MLHPRQPPNSRLLLQLINARNEVEARRELVDIFGPEKGGQAILVGGTWQPLMPSKQAGEWFYRAQGFRAYIPITGTWLKHRVGYQACRRRPVE